MYVFRSIISDDISRQVLTGLRSSRLSLLSLYVEEIRSSRREEARRERRRRRVFVAGAPRGGPGRFRAN